MSSYTVRQVANGFIVEPALLLDRIGFCTSLSDIRVFNDFAEMTKALKADFFPKPKNISELLRNGCGKPA